MFKRVTEFFKEEAIQRTFHYYSLFIYMGLVVGINGPTLPALAEQTGTRLGQMGTIFLLGAIGYALGGLLGGRLLDRMRSHPVLGAGQLLSAALVICMPFIPWFWLLMLFVMFKSLGEGLVSGANIVLLWTHGQKAGPFINALHFFFGLGAFLAPFIVANLVTFPLGYRWAYWAIGGFGLLLGLRMLFLPGSPKPAHSPVDEQGAPVPVYKPLIFAAALYLFFYVGAEFTFGGWIYTYAASLNVFSASGAAYLTSGFWLAFTLGRLLSIPVAARFTPRQVIPVGLIGCIIVLILPVMLPASRVLLWLVTLVLGFCLAPLWPMGFTLAGHSIKLTARLSSILMLGDSLGGMLLPWLVGLIIDLTGPQAMVTLVLGSMVLNLLAYILLIQLTRRSPSIA